jgi:putative ABC transport system substrate-binding protein
LGWIIDRNVQIDFRWAAGCGDRIHTFAAELVELKPDVLLANSSAALEALRRQTRTIPIVFAVVADPVGQGFVQSMARPGGNITGFSYFESSMGGKWLEVLKEIAPTIPRVAVVFNPQTAPTGGSYFLQPIEALSPSFGLTVIPVPVHAIF